VREKRSKSTVVANPAYSLNLALFYWLPREKELLTK
jgi:hypothetical protein